MGMGTKGVRIREARSWSANAVGRMTPCAPFPLTTTSETTEILCASRSLNPSPATPKKSFQPIPTCSPGYPPASFFNLRRHPQPSGKIFPTVLPSLSQSRPVKRGQGRRAVLFLLTHPGLKNVATHGFQPNLLKKRLKTGHKVYANCHRKKCKRIDALKD
jgi:hypothetical protein